MLSGSTISALVGSTAIHPVPGDLNHPDNIIFDIKPNLNGGTGVSTSGFGHPTCLKIRMPPPFWACLQ
jgi:hypothetical protein